MVCSHAKERRHCSRSWSLGEKWCLTSVRLSSSRVGGL
jgi:hypothetical protein